MSKLQKIALTGLLLMVAALVYMEASKPEKINWFPSYTTHDKIPLGTYVLDKLLAQEFGDNYIKIDLPPFEVLRDGELEGTYLFINNNVNFDASEVEKLYNWVEKGNTVFISANQHSSALLDTLNLEITNEWLVGKLETQPLLNLSNEALKADTPYHIEHDFRIRYFEEIDTLHQIVLGVCQAYNDTLKITQPKINFIKAPVGNGNFYLHNQPEIFSNYFLLWKSHAKHTENVLSYINNGQKLYWDNHYKSGKPINISPLYILLNNKYLKWAYYFVLIGAVLYVLFEGKRKQRSIPIVNPLRNQTYDYTRTIAGMYLDRKEYHGIARKQIALFLNYVRTSLRVPTNIMNTRFFEAVAARSSNTIEETKALFSFIEKIERMKNISQQELKELHNKIESFKNQ